MSDLFNQILEKQTAPGQMFETKVVVNEQGVSYNEYIHFPDSLRGFLDFGLLHEEKDWLIYEGERYSYKQVFEKSAHWQKYNLNERDSALNSDGFDDDFGGSNENFDLDGNLNALIDDT